MALSKREAILGSSPFLSFSMKHYNTSQDISLVVLRLIVGGIFIYAGLAKLFFWSTPMPDMAPALVILMKFLSIVEPIGGVALIIGFLTRWAGASLTLIMFGSLFFVYFLMFVGFFTSMKGTGMDYNVLIMAGSFILATFGGGKWTVDALMKRS